MSDETGEDATRSFWWRARPCEWGLAVGGAGVALFGAILLLVALWSVGHTLGQEGWYGFYPSEPEFPAPGGWDAWVVSLGRALILFRLTLEVPDWASWTIYVGLGASVGLTLLSLLAATMFYRCPSCGAHAFAVDDSEGAWDSPEVRLDPPAICRECGARLRAEQ